VLQKAGLSAEADPKNDLGGFSETMYFMGVRGGVKGNHWGGGKENQ
jgi:hypothetical protein